MSISMPKTISGWCMWLFFLFFGLGTIVSALSVLLVIAPWLALAYAVLSLIGM